MSSYAISQNYDVRDLLATALGALWAWLRWLTLLLVAGVGLAAVFAVVVAFWLPLCQIAGALVIIAAFGWATYPRTRAPRSGWGVRP